MIKNYKLFTRTSWSWVYNEKGTRVGKKLGFGPKKHVGYAETEDEARSKCKIYNDKHYGKKSNPLVRMMEYTKL